jgi:hypothetical protein
LYIAEYYSLLHSARAGVSGTKKTRVVVVLWPGFTWVANPWVRRGVSPANHGTVCEEVETGGNKPETLGVNIWLEPYHQHVFNDKFLQA